jgi:SOS-response transcriptional repressor LexA
MKSVSELGQITKRQESMYKYFRKYHERNRFGPSLREAMKHFRFSSPNSVMAHVRPLMKKGWLEGRPNVARSIIPTIESLRHEL